LLSKDNASDYDSETSSSDSEIIVQQRRRIGIIESENSSVEEDEWCDITEKWGDSRKD